MAEYKIIDDFQVKNMHVIVLDRPVEDSDYGKSVYIDGEGYQHIFNSVRQWIQLPDVDLSFAGKVAVFR